MLTLPKIITRDAVPTLGIRESVPMSGIAPAVDRCFSRLFAWCEAHGIEPCGAAFIRYNVIDMQGLLQLEFGVPVAAATAGADDIVAGELPAGRYATVTYWGPYDDLMDVNAILIGWARQKGIDWDMTEAADGDHFACRLEIYNTDPATESDTSKWETEVTIKLA